MTNIDSSPSGDRVIHPIERVQKKAHVSSFEQYEQMYRESVDHPEQFWSKIARNEFHWEKPFSDDKVLAWNFDRRKGKVFVEWFKDGVTNICYNAVDRHAAANPDRIAFHWEGNDPGDDHHSVTYGQLKDNVCRWANVLRNLDVKRGDRVAIYLPMMMEIVYAMLACARIGAVHSVVFAGFSAESLANRILDSGCKIVITADAVMRGNKLVRLKDEIDEACVLCEKNGYQVDHVVVVSRLGSDKAQTSWNEKRDKVFIDLSKEVSTECPIEWMGAEDPLFTLYTSGSTGNPKGMLHTVAGYMVYAATTFKYIFDYHAEDIFWCGADAGWITGHTYIIYGPLLNGATSVIYEGVPTYPDAGRLWSIVDKYNVTQFYTAPTLIRALMKIGLEPLKKYSRSTLRVLGSVGEPINPEAWMWYYNNVGNASASVVDTYWQTETGGIMLTPLPGATPAKPGSATFPFFGVQPAILTEKGEELAEERGTEQEGFLCMKFPWPGIARTIFGDHERYEMTYFDMFKGYYVSGDGCKRDKDTYYWLTGRVDDVLNVSGHRLGTAEIESAFVSHASVAECAVVPYPHDIKGQGIYCYVTLKEGIEGTDELRKTLTQHVRHEIGPIATPDIIVFAPSLPKTRSGKTMRRILRKIAEGTEGSGFGDTSTLIDPGVIDELIRLRPIKYTQ